MSGQLDIVIELPFLPSFPTPGANERLYLAESVALAIEVNRISHDNGVTSANPQTGACPPPRMAGP
jgi:hypothetical protein